MRRVDLVRRGPVVVMSADAVGERRFYECAKLQGREGAQMRLFRFPAVVGVVRRQNTIAADFFNQRRRVPDGPVVRVVRRLSRQRCR